jgi:ATP-dependent RNA circularization protein (DNA/RNA ligase family)
MVGQTWTVPVQWPDSGYAESLSPKTALAGADGAFLDFDIRRENSPHLLSREEGMQVLQTYGLPNVTHDDVHQASDDATLRALLVEVNDQGREGSP